MKAHALRLSPDQDLKISLEYYVREHQLRAGIILTCVGSLNGATLRMADQNDPTTLAGKFEIISLVGTLCPDGCHLHIALSDKEGRVVGGHLLAGCPVYTTAEIAIGEIEDLTFARAVDAATGFRELVIAPRAAE